MFLPEILITHKCLQKIVVSVSERCICLQNPAAAVTVEIAGAMAKNETAIAAWFFSHILRGSERAELFLRCGEIVP